MSRRQPRGADHRRKSVDPARLAAYDLLRAVTDDGAYANLALPGLLRDRRLTGRDAAFATELAFGTLRLRGRYDAILSLCASRPLAQIDPRVLDVLRLGAHQLLGMQVPDYAAVSASAALIRRVGRSRTVGFVNAVLRRMAARDVSEWLADIPPPAAVDADGHLFAEQSHPEWIGTALADALSAVRARTELPELLAADNTAAPVTLVARPGRIGAEELIDTTGGQPGRWSPWAVRATGDPGRWAPVRDGRAAVQDEGSQLVVLALSRAAVSCREDRWLDMCAGPGGKAADLAGLAAAAGAQLTAVEVHPHRARLVQQAVAGAPGRPAQVVVGDARSIDLPGGCARVLLDAPCTGLGAIRRRPDLRWRRGPGDLPGLRALQTGLLDRAVQLAAVGGVIGYATCSPHLAETDEIVAAVRRAGAEVEPVPAGPLLPEVTGTGPGPALRLWPHRHDTDGMYLALLRRTG